MMNVEAWAVDPGLDPCEVAEYRNRREEVYWGFAVEVYTTLAAGVVAWATALGTRLCTGLGRTASREQEEGLDLEMAGVLASR